MRRGQHRYLERQVGTFAPNMVRLWDDLFMLLERVGLHVLLTPYDTFFMWTRWRHHPYNQANGGPCSGPGRWLECPEMRAAIKARLAFASDRWGGSPALFAWDLWNEMHPAHGGDDPASFAPFIDDVGGWLRAREIERHGRAHLQTVSVFGPELVKHPAIAEPIFRHPRLDFANTHLYETGTIDDPKDTVAPALAVGRLMRLAVEDARDGRPVFDSEHGPIHRFKDKKRTLPAAFDDEYFRHMQWAHLASGGAGGGMRWPNRNPHILTPGMREAQHGLAGFLPLIEWRRFHRRNLNLEAQAGCDGIAVFACGDGDQALLWLLRADLAARNATLPEGAAPVTARPTVPGLAAGRYAVTLYDTSRGAIIRTFGVDHPGTGPFDCGPIAIERDVAIAIRSQALA
jgi:mannan endo-1,4-beta-mannosidase